MSDHITTVLKTLQWLSHVTKRQSHVLRISSLSYGIWSHYQSDRITSHILPHTLWSNHRTFALAVPTA